MKLSKYIACICEGAAEQAIIECLLDANKLIFTYDDMIEGEVIRCRSAKKFEERYLRKGFDEKITVLRILDSRREKFKLSKAYAPKIDVINVITAPEIEMLIILNPLPGNILCKPVRNRVRELYDPWTARICRAPPYRDSSDQYSSPRNIKM